MVNINGNEDISVLYVEDDFLFRLMVSGILKKVTKNIILAEDGEEGMKAYIQYRPDIVITDVRMPGMSGLELIKKIREVNKEVIVIISSSYADSETLLDFIDLGINYFVLKPINAERLLDTFEKCSSLIRLNRRVRHQFEEIQRLNHEIIEELKIAKKIQKKLIKNEMIDLKKLKIAYKYIPLKVISGDYFEIIKVDEDKTFVFLADITGHGIPAALYTTLLKSSLFYLTKDTYSPAEIFNRLNHDLQDVLEEGFYIPAIAVLIDKKNMKMSYTNSSGPLPLLYSKEEKSLVRLNGKNLMIGLETTTRYTEYYTDIKLGDRIYLYTDGLFCIKNEERKYCSLSYNFLLDIIGMSSEYPLEESIDYILKTVKGNFVDAFFDDDVTIIEIEI